ncbi:MAG: ABC transporter permease [Cyclobacteriaceae bacterium]
MLKNYFLLGFRTLVKRKLYSFINIAGLSLALGCCLVCFAFVSFFYKADQFHEKVGRLFTVQEVSIAEGREVLNGRSPLPLADHLLDLSQVESVVRVSKKPGLITVEDETFEEVFTFAEKDFFSLFTFPLKAGSDREWGDPSQVILDHSSAIKYFDDRNPVGQSVTVRFTDADGREQIQAFTVAGVAEEFPRNASFRFKVLLPFEFMNRLGVSFEDWTASCDATMVLLHSPTDASQVEAAIQSHVKTYNVYHPDFPLERLHFEPLTSASLNSYKVSDDVFAGAPKFVFVILIVISFFLIIMACFNYMNIAIAMASFRVKEIGVRKVMGSARSQLIKQFITENLILCVLALATGLILAETVFVPSFSSYFGLSLWLDYGNAWLWITCIGLIVLAALGGAGYPAFYISSFKPVEVLKDKLKISGKGFFRRSLLTFQFFLSYVSITTAIAFILNTKFQRAKDWGYDQQNKLIVNVDQSADQAALINTMKQHPSILETSGSVESFGMESKKVIVKIEGELSTVDLVRVGTTFPKMMGFTFVEGQSFDKESESKNAHSVLVNESFVSTSAMTDPIGNVLYIDDHEFTVAGVMRDFHFEPFTELIKPLVVAYAPDSLYRHVAFQYASGDKETAELQLKKAWKEISPEKPLLMYEQASVFDNDFRSYDTATNVMKSAALITVLIGVFGLFGLSSLTLSGKMKELAVRKVMGSNDKQLGWILNKEIIWLLSIACGLGMPLSYFFLKSFLLEVSLYAMPLRPSLFIETLLAMIVVALLAVSFHLYRLTRISPAAHLRDE